MTLNPTGAVQALKSKQAAGGGGVPAQSGGALSYAQLEGLWVQAGGDPSVAPTMAAIALAESSGNPGSTNPTDNNGTQTSWGLWQISDGTHNEPSGWNDPLTNAKMAVAKYNDGGFHPWGTWSTGAYKQYMQSGVAPDTNAEQEVAQGGGGGAVGGVGVDPNAPGADATTPKLDGQLYDPKTQYADDPQLDQEIATLFPNFAWLMTDPQISNVLRFAAKTGASAQWVQAEVQNSDWWRKNSDSIKNWQTLQQNDPSEALQQMHNAAAEIIQQAGQIGMTLGQDRANQIAQESLQYNWNSSQLQQALYAEAQRAMGATTTQQATNESQIAGQGTAQSYAQQAIQDAAQYLMRLDPTTAQQLGFKVATGQMDPAALQSAFIGQAKARFLNNPDIMNAIDKGVTPAQVLAPYQQTIGNLLEISPDQVDFTDPKYKAILSTTDPRGNNRLMTETEAATWARSQPEWKQTQNYKDTATQATQAILTTMGKVAV